MNVQYFLMIGTSAKATHVYIDPCTAAPCTLHKGKNSTISVAFNPTGTVTKVKAIVHGVIAGIPVPFPITGDDGCQNSGLTCPLKGGVEVKYSKAIPVLSQYPSVSTYRHFKIFYTSQSVFNFTLWVCLPLLDFL